MRVKQPVLRAALLLGAFAALSAGLVTLVHEQTAPRIRALEQARLIERLQALAQVPPDTGLVLDTQVITEPQRGTAQLVTVYRLIHDQQVIRLVFEAVTPQGYSGPIRLLIGLSPSGAVTGVEVISHRETPGIGDKIERRRSAWIEQFTGHTLGHPPPEQWMVRQDDGAFDAISSATITSRAVIGAIRHALVYFSQHKQVLLESILSHDDRADTAPDRP